MGLAAFNRMRRVEAMKAENIKKEEKAMDLDKTNEKAANDCEEVKTTDELEEVKTTDELSVKDEPVRRSRKN